MTDEMKKIKNIKEALSCVEDFVKAGNNISAALWIETAELEFKELKAQLNEKPIHEEKYLFCNACLFETKHRYNGQEHQPCPNCGVDDLTITYKEGEKNQW